MRWVYIMIIMIDSRHTQHFLWVCWQFHVIVGLYNISTYIPTSPLDPKKCLSMNTIGSGVSAVWGYITLGEQILYTIQQVNNNINVCVYWICLLTLFYLPLREKVLDTLLTRCLTEHDDTRIILFAVPELPTIV